MPILGGWNHWKAFLKLGFSRGQKIREGNTFVGTPSWVNQIPISLIPEIADVLAAFWESKKPSIFWSAFCMGPCSTPRSSYPKVLRLLPRATSETFDLWGFRALSIVSSNISQLVMLMIFQFDQICVSGGVFCTMWENSSHLRTSAYPMNGKHWFSRNLIPRACQSSRSIWRHGWWIYVLLMSWTKCQQTPPKNILVTNAGFRSVPRWMQSKGLSIVQRNGGLMTELWQNWMLWRCMKHEVRFGGNTSMPSWNIVTCFNNLFGGCVLHKAVLSKKCDKWKRGYYPQSSRKGSTLWFFYPKGELQMFNFTCERLAPRGPVCHRRISMELGLNTSTLATLEAGWKFETNQKTWRTKCLFWLGKAQICGKTLVYRTTVLEECHHQASSSTIMKHQHKTSSNINIDIIHWEHLSILDWPLAAKSSVMQGVARELFRLFVEVVRVKMENDAVFSNRTAWFCCRLWSMYIDILHTHSIYIYMWDRKSVV